MEADPRQAFSIRRLVLVLLAGLAPSWPAWATPAAEDLECWLAPRSDGLEASAAWATDTPDAAKVMVQAPESFTPTYHVDVRVIFGTTDHSWLVGPETASALEEFEVEVPLSKDMCWSEKQADYLTQLRVSVVLVDDKDIVQERLQLRSAWYACESTGIVLVDQDVARALKHVWSDSLREELEEQYGAFDGNQVFGPGE